jgi:hypothetical protein
MTDKVAEKKMVPGMNDTEKSALIEKRKNLEAKIRAIKDDFRRGLDKDSSERAVEMENADVLNEILRVSEIELAKVNEILNKA